MFECNDSASVNAKDRFRTFATRLLTSQARQVAMYGRDLAPSEALTVSGREMLDKFMKGNPELAPFVEVLAATSLANGSHSVDRLRWESA